MESPKKRFLKNDVESKAFAAIAHSDRFIKATDVAMLEMVYRQGMTSIDATAQAVRLQGAKEFLTILENLGDSAPEPVAPNTSLNYNT